MGVFEDLVLGIGEWSAISKGDTSPCGGQDRMTGGDIPFHGATQTGIDISRTVRHQTEF